MCPSKFGKPWKAANAFLGHPITVVNVLNVYKYFIELVVSLPTPTLRTVRHRTGGPTLPVLTAEEEAHHGFLVRIKLKMIRIS